MQIRCKNHDRCIETHPRPVLNCLRINNVSVRVWCLGSSVLGSGSTGECVWFSELWNLLVNPDCWNGSLFPHRSLHLRCYSCNGEVCSKCPLEGAIAVYKMANSGVHKWLARPMFLLLNPRVYKRLGRPMFLLLSTCFQVPGLVLFDSYRKSMLFWSIHASGAPMCYFTDTK